MRALRSILGIKWHDKVSNVQILDQADCTSIESLLIKSQLRWTGHVIRMEDNRMPKQLLYGELLNGSRSRGRPKLRFKDTLKANLQWSSTSPRDLENRAMDRSAWRAAIHLASKNFEEQRRQKLLLAHKRRHQTASSPKGANFPCPHCDKQCASRIGLHSHLRTHTR